MIDNQRISPNLRRKVGNQQVKKATQAGFTLVELMVVIAIMGIMMTIAVGPWSKLKSDEAVRAAAGTIRSAMVSARMKALASGATQYVGVDMATAAVATVVYGQSTFDVTTKTWAATSAWEPLKGVRVYDSKSTGANPAAANTGIKTIQFKSTGEAMDVLGITKSKSIRINAQDTTVTFAMLAILNGVVGRVRVKDCKVTNSVTGECL